MSAGDRLKEMRERSGLSMDRLARLCGYKGASSLQKYEDADREWINAALVEKLARHLVGLGKPPITVEEVWSLSGVNPVLTSQSPRIRQGGPEREPHASAEFGASGITPYAQRDLPLLGQSRGGESGYFFGNGAEVLSLTYRPIELLNVRDAYAVYVHGDSMYPRYKPGEMLYVDPIRPVSPGDDVVIQLNDGQGFVKELVRRTAKSVICKQHNPSQEVEFPTANVRSIHLIITATKVRV